MRLIRIYSILIFGVCVTLSAYSLAHAQETIPSGPATTTLSNEEIVQEVLKYRTELYNLLGIPEGSIPSVLDFLYEQNPNLKLFDQLDLPGLESVVNPGGGNFVGPSEDLRLSFNTKTFRPGDTVKVTAASNLSPLTNAVVTWYLNGQQVASGIGVAVYEFVLGPVGSAETLRVSVRTPDGTIKEVTHTIRPAHIHFTWFSNTRVPEWYSGKALPAFGSQITIVAIPDIRIGNSVLNPQDLIYEWSLNGGAPTTNPEISGIGKNTYTLNTSTARGASYTLGVRIKDQQQRIVHEEEITPQLVNPETLFYKVDALYGTESWQSPLSRVINSGQDITLQAEPFYMPQDGFSELLYTWKFGSRGVGERTKERTFRLSTNEGNSGRQNISVSFEHASNILQRGGGKTIINITR